MFLLIITGIAILSVLMALYSLKKQKNLQELKKVKKSLARSKVLYHRDSSI
jgi:hypothetical protein